jgi:DNA-binding response OmpR family regulator
MTLTALHLVQEPAPKEALYTLTLDDDPLVSKLIEKGLTLPTLTFVNPIELKPKLHELQPKAVFIDIHLPEGSGLNLIPEMRQAWPYVPLIVITADKDDELLAEALSRGADDFIRKPIRMAELKARLHKRWQDNFEKQALSVNHYEDIEIDVPHFLLEGPTSKRNLSPTEMKLLNRLVQAQGASVSRAALKFSCWNQISVSENALDRKIHELRKALKDVGSRLQIATLYGEGFQLKKPKTNS